MIVNLHSTNQKKKKRNEVDYILALALGNMGWWPRMTGWTTLMERGCEFVYCMQLKDVYEGDQVDSHFCYSIVIFLIP